MLLVGIVIGALGSAFYTGMRSGESGRLGSGFKQLLEEQKERHEGGSKWIGTGGTSPFGAFGFNPEGFRIGQGESRHRRAIKVWDERHFKNLDEGQELNTRNIKMAMRNLREFTREGIAEDRGKGFGYRADVDQQDYQASQQVQD